MVPSSNIKTPQFLSIEEDQGSMLRKVAETFGDTRGSILSSKIGGGDLNTDHFDTLGSNSARYKTHTNGFGMSSATVDMKANHLRQA